MSDLPLFPTEAQIARRVLGPGRTDEWKGLAQILERRGFPKIDHQHGGRYWPACELWYKMRYGVARTSEAGPLGKPDGGETCPERKHRGSIGKPSATVHRLRTGAPDAT